MFRGAEPVQSFEVEDVEREGWGGEGGLFSCARISNFFEFGFSSLERVLDSVDANDFLVAVALVDAVLSIFLVMPEFSILY